MTTSQPPQHRIPWFYRLVLSIAAPIIRRWGRLQVSGERLLDRPGPILVVGNHDTYWDPVVIGVAALGHRQIRAMAKSTLWRTRLLAGVLNGMGQLRITRGRADMTELVAIAAALRSGGCVGVFPEGRISKGQQLRAYSGAGWLAKTVPQTKVVAVAVTGAVDLIRFPRRPRIVVEFFEPEDGQRRPGESSIGFARRVTAEVRDKAPAVASGRRPISFGNHQLVIAAGQLRRRRADSIRRVDRAEHLGSAWQWRATPTDSGGYQRWRAGSTTR